MCFWNACHASARVLKNSDDTSRHVMEEIFANEAVIVKMDHKALLMKAKVMENWSGLMTARCEHKRFSARRAVIIWFDCIED